MSSTTTFVFFVGGVNDDGKGPSDVAPCECVDTTCTDNGICFDPDDVLAEASLLAGLLTFRFFPKNEMTLVSTLQQVSNAAQTAA